MSKRVNGAALKAALNMSAPKQVAAGGYMVSGAAVTFRGKTAFAAWRTGRTYDMNSRSFRINYPLLSDNAALTRIEADLIAAYTLHETGHVMFTNNKSAEIGDVLNPFKLSRSVVHPFANGLEDGRMEHSVVQARIARNAHTQFAKLLNMLVADVPPTWNPCDIVHAPFTLAVLSREAFGNGNAFSSTLLSRIPEPKRALYARAVEACKTAPIGYDNDCWAYATAAQFLADWAALTGQKYKPAPKIIAANDEGHIAGFPTLGEDGQDEDFAPDVEFAEDEGAAPVTEGDDDVRPPIAEDDGDGFGGLDADNADDEGDADGEAFGDRLDSRSLDLSPEDDPKDAEEDDAPTVSGGSGDEPGDTSTPFDDVVDSNSKPLSAEPSVDAMFKRISKRTEGVDKSDLGEFSPAGMVDLVEEHGRSWRKDERIQLDNPIGALKTQLSKMLLSVDRIGWENGSTSGRFDVRRTSRLMAGSERVFKLRTESEAVKTAVTLVVDLSGSMAGERMTCAAQAAWAVATAIERVGCEVQVVGFSDMCRGGGDPGKYVEDMGGNRPPPAALPRYTTGGMAVIKDYHQKCATRRAVFEKMHMSTTGGTPDYHITRTAAEQLVLKDAQRKIVLAFTDGCGDYARMKTFAVAFERIHKIPILGIGIQTGDYQMRKAYTRYACIRDVNDLATTAIRSLITQLEGMGDGTLFVQEEALAA